MKQILNIFRTDTRHFWPEITASLAAAAAFVLIYPNQWRSMEDYRGANEMRLLVELLVFLVPATWWLLVARVVHAEGLVGENQFWITRPYEWKKLLAAKTLFLAVWLFVPLLLAQAALVTEAGLQPLGHASGWLSLLVLDSGLAIVPLVALATVTANFARMALALFGALLVVVISIVLFTTGFSGYEATVPHPHRIVSFVLLVVCGCAAIVLQYAVRRAWLARALLLAALVLAVAAPVAIYASRETTIDRAYSNVGRAVQLAWAPHYLPRRIASERSRMVYIELVLQVSGVADGYAVQADDVKVSIDAPGGFHWTAPWWSTQKPRFLPGTHTSRIQIMMPRDLYERYKSVPLTLHVALAMTELQAGKPRSVAIGKGDFAVPDFGVCAVFNHEALRCRTGLGDPQLTYISTTWSTDPCPATQAGAPPAAYSSTWAGTAYHDPVEFGPLAVAMAFANLWPRNSHGGEFDHIDGIALCPGTPVTFTSYNVIQRSQAGLTLSDFHLPID